MQSFPTSTQMRITDQYHRLVDRAGSRSMDALISTIRSELPYPVEITRLPARSIAQCTVSGRCATYPEQGKHEIVLAEELDGLATLHTLAHELYHLRYHRIDQVTMDMEVSYLLSQPEWKDIPPSIIRSILHDQWSGYAYRTDRSNIWEQEAECFAGVAVCGSLVRERAQYRTSLFKTLGSPVDCK